MSTIAFYTAKGAPGATTAAMLASALWPRRNLLIDCDPAGGDIALRLPAADGGALDPSIGVLSLLPMARRPMQPSDVLKHAQAALGGGEVLAGLASPDQAGAVGALWPVLGDLFVGMPEHDVFIDLGRLPATSPVLPVGQRADLAVCVIRATVSGTMLARARLRSVLPALARDGVGPRNGFLLRAPDRRSADSAATILLESYPDLTYFGWLPEDVTGAKIFEGERVTRPERTLLVRSGRSLVGDLDGVLPAQGRRGVQAAPAAGQDVADAKPRRRGRRAAKDAKAEKVARGDEAATGGRSASDDRPVAGRKAARAEKKSAADQTAGDQTAGHQTTDDQTADALKRPAPTASAIPRGMS